MCESTDLQVPLFHSRVRSLLVVGLHQAEAGAALAAWPRAQLRRRRRRPHRDPRVALRRPTAAAAAQVDQHRAALQPMLPRGVLRSHTARVTPLENSRSWGCAIRVSPTVVTDEPLQVPAYTQ